MHSSRALGKAPCLFFLAVGATSWGCLEARQPTAGPPVAPSRALASAATVSSFGMNVLDAEGELAFLRALDLTVMGDRTLVGPAFEELVSLPGARARQITLALGGQQLVLTHFDAPPGHAVEVARANDAGFQHVALVVRDMDAAYARLERTRMRPVSASPQTLPASNPVAAGIRAVYFRDPEGHFMELLQFPPDKGDAMWHRETKQLFLGIDHSAIVSRNTNASLRFYRDVLGMRVVSESVNEGREQELLSAVPGARVHITSLRGASGPGVELLEYAEPRDGKPFPEATRSDSVHWEIALEVRSVEDTLRALRDPGLGTAAPAHGAVVVASPGQARSALVPDPDGHTVRLSERGARQ